MLPAYPLLLAGSTSTPLDRGSRFTDGDVSPCWLVIFTVVSGRARATPLAGLLIGEGDGGSESCPTFLFVREFLRPSSLAFLSGRLARLAYFLSRKSFANHWSRDASSNEMMSLIAIFIAPLMSACNLAPQERHSSKDWNGRQVSVEPHL